MLLSHNLRQARLDGRVLGKIKKQVRPADTDAPKTQSKGHVDVVGGQWRCSGCGGAEGKARSQRQEVQRWLRRRGLVAQAPEGGVPDDIPIACYLPGAVANVPDAQAIWSKGCLDSHGKECRLKCLAKGLRPYFKYKYQVWGPARSWINKKMPGSGAAAEGDIVDCEGGLEPQGCCWQLILGQVAGARVLDLLQEQLLDVPECLVPVVGEQAR